MKLMATALLSFLSLTTFAQEYVKVQAENDSFRDFSREEFSLKLGESEALLPYYSCNDRDELDPFHAPIRINPEKNSFRIQAYKSEEYIIYQEGIFYSPEGKKLKNINDTFYNYVVKTLARFEKIPSTKKLLRHLEESYFPITLRFGGNSFAPTIEGGKTYQGIYRANAISYISRGRMPDDSLPFNDIGVGGFINWHPKLEVETIEADGKKRSLDPDVALAHEMFHAFDSIRGLLDMRFILGEDYEYQLASEYRAVYFENLVRKELGINFRKYYSGPEGGDLLDNNGQPISIPAPCLQ
jgi:hypothetical protein